MPASRSPADATTAPEGDVPWRGRPFSWEFTTPLFIGSALNPVNSSLIATALLPIARGLGVPLGQTAALAESFTPGEIAVLDAAAPLIERLSDLL